MAQDSSTQPRRTIMWASSLRFSFDLLFPCFCYGLLSLVIGVLGLLCTCVDGECLILCFVASVWVALWWDWDSTLICWRWMFDLQCRRLCFWLPSVGIGVLILVRSRVLMVDGCLLSLVFDAGGARISGRNSPLVSTRLAPAPNCACEAT